MLCACIDIGTNTTRVLVAEAREGRLTEVLQRRAFTRMGKGMAGDGAILPEKIAEVAEVVAEHRRLAEQLGAAHLRVVAALDGRVGVVDVGGGSSELAVGTLAGGVTWSASFPVGSGLLADHYLRSNPPSAAELHSLREHAHGVFDGLEVPRPECAVAVGGSAASLRRLVGTVLEPDTLQRALRVLSGETVEQVAHRFALDPARVRLLPAGILILDAASQRFGRPLQIGKGGIREGVLLELAATGD
jgi:exopolyphosphatase / guanosine-5'-triphosphate,3'-diphosphate pyrophosphatase